MENFIEAIKEWFEWFNSTPLPKDTADFLVDVIKVVGTKFILLCQEYISILFPGY